MIVIEKIIVAEEEVESEVFITIETKYNSVDSILKLKNQYNV